METRELKQHERNLVKHLIGVSKKEGSYDIPDTVEELQDGKMGSIRFVSDMTDRKYAADLVKVEYREEDNIPVIITLTLDNRQELYELEFWKVDFEKLCRYPKPDEVVVINN